MISIELVDFLGGKRPGLYIGTPGELLKVGSFGSEEKARLFDEWLRHFFGDMLKKENKNEQ
jgi:hypothetical protein